MLFLSLLKAKAISGHRCSPVPALTIAAVRESELLLLSRVFSLLRARTRARAWDGPVDHDLMAFNASVRVRLLRCGAVVLCVCVCVWYSPAIGTPPLAPSPR